MKKAKQNKTKPVNIGQTSPWWANQRIVAGMLFALAFLIYANSLSNGFVLDDMVVITKNQFTTQGIAGIGNIFTTHAFEGFYGDDLYWIQVYGARYRPLSMAIFAVIYQFFGDNPTVFHVWNVATYALCCSFLFIVLLRIFKHLLKKTDAVILVGMAVLLFTVHPVHTEVVANIKSNDEILSLLLSLASLYLAVRYCETGNKFQAAMSGIMLFIACFAKENAITFLAIIPLTFFLLKKEWRSFLPLLMSLGAAFLAYMAVRWAVIGLSLGELPMDLINNPFVKVENGQWISVSTQERLAMTFYSLGKYLQLLVFPHPLTTDYYPRYVGLMTFSNPGALASFMAYLSLGVFLVIRILRKKINPVVYGLFFFVATLSIVSNLVFPIGTNLAERFLFMPSVGFCIAAAGLMAPAFNEKRKLTGRIVLAVFGIVLTLFAAKTVMRNPDFESNRTLHFKDIEVSGNSAKIQNTVGALIAGDALKSQDPAEKARLSERAMEHLNKALAIHPSYLEAYFMRGNVYFMQGKYETAVDDYRRCLTLNPNYKDAYGNYALALRETARKWLRTGGDRRKAIEFLEESNRLFPDQQETVDLLNEAKANTGQN